MVEIAKVRDTQSLMDYLASISDSNVGRLTSHRLVYYASARALPLALLNFVDKTSELPRGTSATSMFGAIAACFASASAHDSNVEFSAEVTIAASAAFASGDANTVGNTPVGAVAADAIFCGATFAATEVDNYLSLAIGGVATVLQEPATDFWGVVRADLQREQFHEGASLVKIWTDVAIDPYERCWAEVKAKLAGDTSGHWRFWILWYDGVRAGRDTHPHEMAEVLNTLTQEDWEGEPALLNAKFDPILARYEAEDAAEVGSDADDAERRKSRSVKIIRSQIDTLRTFLDTEYEHYRGKNTVDPSSRAQLVELADALRALRDLVTDLLRVLEEDPDTHSALAVVETNMPVLVEKAMVPAIADPAPQASETIVAMAVTVKTLTEAGTPGDMATKIALAEAGTIQIEKKLLPRLYALFSNWRGSDDV